MQPLILVNAVGLTPRLLEHAPRLSELAKAGWQASLREVVPAVTCSAQATLLTGQPVNRHGVVANGWLFRDTNEVRFWQQSNRLIQAEPLYATARRRAKERGKPFKSAKLFWWFNQGAAVDLSVTPKPWYGVDGNKVFGVSGTPPGLAEAVEKEIGAFPFQAFWGPMSGIASTKWIARCAAEVVRSERPDLSLVYLPHLDYDPQRFGPSGTDMAKHVRDLDRACEPLLDAAKEIGASVWVVSEYGHCDVIRPVYPNRLLRTAGLLAVRPGPFGEQLDTFGSRAFAVCDHQLAHVYVQDPADVPRVRELLGPLPGVGRVLAGEERAEVATRPRPLRRGGPALGAGRLVRVPVLARRRPGAGLRPRGGDPPQAGVRPVRVVLRPEPADAEAVRRPACGREEARVPHDDGRGPTGRRDRPR